VYIQSPVSSIWVWHTFNDAHLPGFENVTSKSPFRSFSGIGSWFPILRRDGSSDYPDYALTSPNINRDRV
jgi:hypothetical protein